VFVEIDGHRLINFCSDDYLGLSQQFGIVAATQDSISRDGVGVTAAPLLYGHHAVHEALEREIAAWLGYPSGLLFGSGYIANLAVLQAFLLEADDLCVQDRLNHPSLIDASRLAGCRLRHYPHLDAEGAMRLLKNEPDGAAILASNGVFHMDGDIAPLRALSLAARVQRALMYVDDTHGTGILGPEGRGCVAEAGLSIAEIPLQMVNLSKALGSFGAVVVGNEELIQHLAETARPYVHATSLPPALASAALTSLKSVRHDEWRRDKLRELTALFRSEAHRHGLELTASEHPIQPLICGDETTTIAMATAMEQEGYLVAAIRPPSVSEGASRLRITLTALHTSQQVQLLAAALSRAYDSVTGQWRQ
jgi:8-amino-7-oxononanoate synthase